jgi:hypothetical protein
MASAHDLSEIARSASEASKVDLSFVDHQRYKSPPPTRPTRWNTLSIY